MTCQQTRTALKRLMVVGSAATGYMMSDFSDMHEYVEQIMERPVFTHEMGSEGIAEEIRKKAHPDFVLAIQAAREVIDKGT